MIIPELNQKALQETHTVSFTVTMAGKKVTSDPGGLLSLFIYQEFNRIPTARLLFSDGSVEDQEFAKNDRPDFSPGKEVEILLGYNQQETTIFKGIITRQAIRVLKHKPYYIEIECKDKSVKSTVVQKSQYHYEQTDHQIIKDLFNNYGLETGDIAATQPKHAELVQYHCTDWDFALMRADANGLYILPQDGKIHLRKPEVKAQPDIQVQFGSGQAGIPIIEFESNIDARNHFDEVKGYTWDHTKQELMQEPQQQGANISTPPSIGGNAERNFPKVAFDQQAIQLYHGGDLETKELQNWVAAKQQRGKLARIRGRVSIRGRVIHAGDTIEINGVSERINGKHLITGVVHQLVSGSWQTDIQFGWRKEFWAEDKAMSTPDAAGLVAGIRGLHIGVVSKIGGDQPENKDKIQVRIPFVAQNGSGSGAEGIWARMASPYAGKDRGFIFRPEKEDEVIVGFINNDPNDAFILGALHNKINTAPTSLKTDKPDNLTKGIVSKEGMQILFDEENKALQLKASTAENSPMIELKGDKISIVFNDGNKIELSSSGVKVKGSRIDLN